VKGLISAVMSGFWTMCLYREDFGQEEKARFGELCSGENGKGREGFAKHVSAQVEILKKDVILEA